MVDRHALHWPSSGNLSLHAFSSFLPFLYPFPSLYFTRSVPSKTVNSVTSVSFRYLPSSKAPEIHYVVRTKQCPHLRKKTHAGPKQSSVLLYCLAAMRKVSARIATGLSTVFGTSAINTNNKLACKIPPIYKIIAKLVTMPPFLFLLQSSQDSKSPCLVLFQYRGD